MSARTPGAVPLTRAAVVRGAALVVAFAVAGVLGGLLWRSRVDIPSGVVVSHHWYPEPWDPGQRAAFAATGWYVVIAAALAVVLTVLALWRSRGSEVLTLAAVLVGAVAAALLMRVVGLHGVPADPQAAAARAADGTRLSGTVAAPGRAAMATLPLISLAILTAWFLLIGPRDEPDAEDEVIVVEEGSGTASRG